MSQDFIYRVYSQLLYALKTSQYKIISFNEYLVSYKDIKETSGNIVILRHDVDRNPLKSFVFASIDDNIGINSSYFLKFKHFERDFQIINKLADLGHDVGYHYAELTRFKGNVEQAFDAFLNNLEFINKKIDISTISMDGQPLYLFDSKDIWKKFDYKSLGIKGEIYLDIDYNEFAYYTDTGRCWNNKKINIRDKVKTNRDCPVYKSTFEMIKAIDEGSFPNKAVINIHPEHWTDNTFDWYKKLIWQSIKNVGKYFLIKIRSIQRRLGEGETG